MHIVNSNMLRSSVSTAHNRNFSAAIGAFFASRWARFDFY